MARELHDTVVQDLVALRWTVAELAANPDVAAHTDELEALSARLATVTETARSVSFRLESPVSDAASLEYALRAEVVALRSAQLAIDLDCLVEESIPREIAALTFRTVREALRNVVQHANASRATVSLSARDGELVAVIRDDGVGVDPVALDAQLRAGHIGVASMRDGVIAAGGTFAITPIASRGTDVRFTLALCESAPVAIPVS